MSVEALVEKTTDEGGSGKLPTKGEVTAWLAASHRRGIAGHTDKNYIGWLLPVFI